MLRKGFPTDRIKDRLEQIRKAVPATDGAVVTSSSAATVAWAGLLKQVLVAIANYDKQIDELAWAHPDHALVKSFPGAGPAMAPRLMAALGSQRERCQSAAEIHRCSGIAPVVASSGKQHWVHWRWACPKFLRLTFHEWALHSIAYSDWAREYYDQQRAKGKRRNTAIRSLAFKWIRILFRCWEHSKPYDEAVYQAASAARRPNQRPTAAVVDLQWKNVAGFSKIAPAGGWRKNSDVYPPIKLSRVRQLFKSEKQKPSVLENNRLKMMPRLSSKIAIGGDLAALVFAGFIRHLLGVHQPHQIFTRPAIDHANDGAVFVAAQFDRTAVGVDGDDTPAALASVIVRDMRELVSAHQ
jgi:hypothetical protein